MLERAFFERPPPEVARDLLGHRIRHASPKPAELRIVETEAYLGPDDPGSHATRGRDTQAGQLWATPGQAYVYVCYGVHQMLNVVAHEPGSVGAVLIRAGEPVDGIDVMGERRGTTETDEIASGPGRLAEALDVTREAHEGADLLEGSLRFQEGQPVDSDGVAVTGRIGLSEGEDRLLRFVDASSPHVSRPVPPEAMGETPDVEMRKR